MCGILGNFGFIEHLDFNNHLKVINEPLLRRGPDQKNSIDVQNFLATHSRLTIHGSQMMVFSQFVLKILLFYLMETYTTKTH